jgi:hypothetical protein
MSDIEKARDVGSEFLKKMLDVKEVKVIKVAKVGVNWEIEAEVYEESSFIKALGLPTRVKDRNIYYVKLNESFEAEFYKRKRQ